ncbi:MAG: hypothetical protein KGO81_01770 [Bacteroidota bacterium]|nr:hypothetical protein [Bacteroidota bacterium]
MLYNFFFLQSSATKYIVIGTIFGTLFVIFVGVLIVSFVFEYQKKQKLHQKEILLAKAEFEQQLLQAQIEVQENTLSILAKELHDNINQLLGSTKMLLGVTERNLSEPPATLLEAEHTLAKAITELRALSKSLNKEWLEQFSFSQNLNTEINRLRTAKEMLISVQLPPSIQLKKDEQIILFRIVQEAMQNILKHAQASELHILVEEIDKSLIVVIKDNGIGFDITNQMTGMGIMNIKQRTRLLGGHVQWMSEQNNGTKVVVKLPIKMNIA